MHGQASGGGACGEFLRVGLEGLELHPEDGEGVSRDFLARQVSTSRHVPRGACQWQQGLEFRICFML